MFLINFRKGPLIPNLISLNIIPLRQTVSNADLKSTKQVKRYFPDLLIYLSIKVLSVNI